MATLLIAEHDNVSLSPHTMRALTAALALDESVDVLVAGNGCHAVALELSQLAGIREVLMADSPALAHFGPELVSALVVPMAGAYDAIVAPATANGRSVLPRVAALLDVAQISDVVEVLGNDTFKRPVYAGNALETLQSADSIKVITVRTTAFALAPRCSSEAAIRTIPVSVTGPDVRFVSEDLAIADRPSLADARIVISGGRGFKSRENFEQLLFPLAEKLGAAVGASRAAVDSGFAGNDLQVGQTGQMVAPDLYIACGISGAIQHLAGMQQSKVIVAINSDADAPIFKVADYGLVGDLFSVLPQLTAKL